MTHMETFNYLSTRLLLTSAFKLKQVQCNF